MKNYQLDISENLCPEVMTIILEDLTKNKSLKLQSFINKLDFEGDWEKLIDNIEKTRQFMISIDLNLSQIQFWLKNQIPVDKKTNNE